MNPEALSPADAAVVADVVSVIAADALRAFGPPPHSRNTFDSAHTVARGQIDPLVSLLVAARAAGGAG